MLFLPQYRCIDISVIPTQVLGSLVHASRFETAQSTALRMQLGALRIPDDSKNPPARGRPGIQDNALQATTVSTTPQAPPSSDRHRSGKANGRLAVLGSVSTLAETRARLPHVHHSMHFWNLLTLFPVGLHMKHTYILRRCRRSTLIPGLGFEQR